MSNNSFTEKDIYVENDDITGVKPSLSKMFNAYKSESVELSLDDSPAEATSKKKKGVGFGDVIEVSADKPTKKIAFGAVLDIQEEEDSPPSPPPPPPPQTVFETPQMEEEYEEEEEYEDYEEDPVAERYFAVAEKFSEGGDKASELRGKAEMPSRSPYKPGMKMMHGAHYFPAFKTFIENGGCAHYKNSVMLNIRVNNVSELDVMEGTCKLNFFLDCAFWVPKFNVEHYSDPDSIGHFALYEPIINFPEMKETQWLKREVEFSKHPGARRHEVQLGQNFETAKKVTEPSKSEFLHKKNSNEKMHRNDARSDSAYSPSAGARTRHRAPSWNSTGRKMKPSLANRNSGTSGGAPPVMETDESIKVEMRSMETEKTKLEQRVESVKAQKTSDLWKSSIQSAKRGSRVAKFANAVNMVSSAVHATDAFTANLHRSNTRKEKDGEAGSGHASDIYAHWPRMWRVLLSDEDLEKYEAMSKAEKKKIEPTNAKPQNVPPEMKKLLLELDLKREKDLEHPDEGLVFSTFEIQCLSRQTYELFDFPFDLQDVDIVVRLEAPKADPLKRHIIPCAHDKAFFCSSRVPPLTEWLISKNLDWKVEKGVRGNSSLDGGKERLVASILVLRKSYYYSQHFIGILFLMTSSVFSIFTIDADQIDARSNIVFSLLLTVVAFNYSCSESIPKVPYATILEVFINTCFLSVLAVGAITFAFTFIQSNLPDVYDKSFEQYFGAGLFFLWCLGNFVYWYDIFHRTEQIKKMVDEDEQIGWLKFKEKKFDDNTRARGLASVKVEPKLTQVKNFIYDRTASMNDTQSPTLREALNRKADRAL